MLNLWSKNLILTSSSSKISTEPVTFNYTGTVQTYTVPKEVKKVHIDMIGGAGIGAEDSTIGNKTVPSAYGGRVECDLDVTNISLLYVYVGGSAANGFNSGTSAINHKYYGSVYGAGATDIRTIEGDLHSRLIVAGGGGSYDDGAGGVGGGLVGGQGWSFIDGRQDGGAGGTQTKGGAGGSSGTGGGKAGGFGYGGAGYGGTACNGGAGWYGGGGSPNANNGYAAGSGGGSSYTHPDLCTNVVHTQGYKQAVGDGWLVITPVA
jgi:hypothetical protein